MTQNTKSGETPERIVVECDLDATPEKVWRALTEPALLAAWLEPDAIQSTDDGHVLRLDFDKEGRTVELETLSGEPNRLLRCRWRSVDQGLLALDSVVAFELSESDTGGTHLRIVHDCFAVLSMAVVQRTFARRLSVNGRGLSRVHPARRGHGTTMRLAA